MRETCNEEKETKETSCAIKREECSKKMMSTKLQWMEETCIEEKESQETSYAIPYT